MERRTAWATAATVGVTFIAVALAVMANTGLLNVGPADRELGHLTSADIGGTTNAASPGDPTPTSPRVVVKYEDVYVTTADAQGDVAATAATVPADTRDATTRLRSNKTAATARSTTAGAKPSGVTSHGNNEPVRDGDNDDD